MNPLFEFWKIFLSFHLLVFIIRRELEILAPFQIKKSWLKWLVLNGREIILEGSIIGEFLLFVKKVW